MAARSTTAPLHVLTCNTHKGYSSFNRRFVLRELRDAVRAQGSDLVFLQEVSGAGARLAKRRSDEIAGHCEYMADQIWSDHAWARNAVVDGLEHGNALLSRFPIVRWTNHLVSVPGDESRGLLHCIVQRPGSDLHLHAVCVHLGLRESHRRQQLARLRDVVLHDVPAAAPLVVAGDFNDWRSRADQALHGTGLVDVFRQSFGRHARSFPAWWPMLRLDRIYVRCVASAHPVRLPRRPWSRLSDHAPLAAEIHL
jgi:endonuclease/exonuclease/phosphatase family metal-dependent hydrolase